MKHKLINYSIKLLLINTFPADAADSCQFNISSPITKYTELDPALCLELRKIVDALIAPGKGLLACDESPSSLEERFNELNIENSESARRDYRQMLFTADKISNPVAQQWMIRRSRFAKYISGIILHHETVYQKSTDDVEFIEVLRQRNVVPGIKVDRGLVQLFGTKDENTTEGLDSLQERCIQYKRDGCHFAKWRCTYTISETTPSQLAMVANANVLARYASICQSARMVPIVEPEILNTGNHGINRSLEVHEEVLSILFRALNEHRVYLEGMILKPAMVLSGIQNTVNCTPQIVAEYTLTALERTVPPAVPAILFLSGGQSDTDSVLNLNAINAYEGKKPWTLSFCYGRALQNEAMNTWSGSADNIEKAQEVFLERAKLCSEAALGQMQLNNGVCTRKKNNSR